VSSITATGKYTFTIKLSKPYAFLLYQLTDANFIPLSPTALKAEGAGFGRKPVSTGAWEVQQWQTGSQIVLVRNPNYRWGPSFVQPGPARIDKLVFRILLDPAAATAALQSGEVDELLLPTASVSRILASGQYSVQKYLSAGVSFLEFNVTQAPFNDLKVRQALNYAINKQAVIQVVLNGFGVPISGVLSPVMYGYWPGIKSYGYSYNPQKALALLAQDGYVKQNGVLEKNGKPLTFTALTSTLLYFSKLAQVVQDQFKQIGVTMNIQTLDFNTEIATVRKGHSQADFLGYLYNIPDIFYIWFHSSQIGDGFGDSFYRDPKLDALIVKMRTTVDDSARNALVAQLERYVSDKALWIPLLDGYAYVAFQPRVKGVSINPRGYVILNNATLS
jgi:peptide/nickel transport system substrate-binding protein